MDKDTNPPPPQADAPPENGADQEVISDIEVAVASIVVSGAKGVEEVRKVRREASLVEEQFSVKFAALEEVLEDRNQLRKVEVGLERKIADLVMDIYEALERKNLDIEYNRKEMALEAEKRSLEVKLGMVLELLEDLKKEKEEVVRTKKNEVQVANSNMCSDQEDISRLEKCRQKDEAPEQKMAGDSEESQRRKIMTLEGQKKFLEDELFKYSQSAAKQVTKEMKELVSSKDKQLHSLQFRIAELEESRILLKQKRITVGRKLDDNILKVIRLSLEVAELEESRTQLMKEVASLKAEKYLAEQALWSTQKSLNDEVKDAESARKETLRALQKLVGELCSGNGEVSDTADFPENEAIRAYVADLETIRIAFKEKEEKVKQMKEENEGLRKKSMLGWISSAVHGWFLLRMAGN